jgi:hypothetical protein
MIVVGCGNTGMKLAAMFSDDPILISTAHQDSANFDKFKVNTFTEDGAGKRFGTGLSIWAKNEPRLKGLFEGVINEKVLIFSSLGGGSGSSSLSFVSKILLEQNNKVLIAGVLPYKKEINPPLANAVQAVNSLVPIISDVSVLLFDNDKLLKRFENDWRSVNNHIVKRVSYLVNLLDDYSVDKYSPLTIDKSELDSVVFGGGFIDVSDDFLEETNPKFTYGKIDGDTKNLLIALFCDLTLDDKKVDGYHRKLTEITNKFAGRAKNCRYVTGILRGKIEWSRAQDDTIKDRAYITIASGLSVDNYLKQVEKMRDDAMERATNYATKTKVGNIVSKKETNILDI